jgi:glycolate oxidase FAD binding subunit
MRSDAVRGDAEIAAAVHDAAASGTPIRIVGRGTWLDAGEPVSAAAHLVLADDSGLVAYAPDDLTVTTRAGTTLRELAECLDTRDQWVALDPEGGPDVTIGATVATCSYGPAAAIFGTVRDQVLGMTVVLGTGEVIRPGGRVVKNVAGFDVTRLMIGAWGTLGVITEVTLRVRPRGMRGDSMAHMRHQLPASHGCREPVVVNARLSVAIRQRFDPRGILNPGIMRESR